MTDNKGKQWTLEELTLSPEEREQIVAQSYYDAGYKAGEDGKTIDANPYPSDHEGNREWVNGWVTGVRDWDDGPEWTI